MTDQQTDETMDVHITLYPENGTAALRQVGLGINPLVLLEVVGEPDGGVSLSLTGSLINSRDELLEFVDMFHQGLTMAIEQNPDGFDGIEVPGEVVEDGADG